jgi:hypothetical protein
MGFMESNGKPSLVFEFMEFGNLLEILESNKCNLEKNPKLSQVSLFVDIESFWTEGSVVKL